MSPAHGRLLNRWIGLASALAVMGCQTGNTLFDIDAGSKKSDLVLDLISAFPLSEARRDTNIRDLKEMEPSLLRAQGFVRRKGGVFGIGNESWMDFYSTLPRTRYLTVDIDVMGWYRRLGARISVYANGERIAILSRRDLRIPQQVSLPADVVRAGTNRIVLQYESEEGGIDIRRARVRYKELSLDLPDSRDGAVIIDAVGGRHLRLPSFERQEYFADVPAGAWLSLEGLRSFGPGKEIELQAEITREGNTTSQHETITPGQAGPLTIAINGGPGPTRIALMAASVDKSRLPDAGIVLESAQVFAPAQHAQAQAFEAPTPNVLIYLIDTLRADHLGVYGYGRDTSPHLDAFADDAMVFEAAQAQSSWTKPVVASMMTGLLPQQHGVQRREDKLPPETRTLAGILQLAGYLTYAVATNSTVFSDFNFDIGFHEFVELGERPTEEVHQLSDVVNERFFKWLENRPSGRPFFAFLHTTDPHEPYMPREPYRGQFASGVLDPTIAKGPAVRRALAADPTLDIVRLGDDMQQLYDAEVAFNDAQFGALIDRLKEDGLYESMLIIVLSDHGEEFLDHGAWSHGVTLYQEVLRVPLIIKLPGNLHSGQRVWEIAQHVDLFPTVIQAAGLDYAVPGTGLSLLNFAGTQRAARRPAISHLGSNSTLTESALLKTAKLIRRTRPGTETRTMLFDLAANPGETALVSWPVTAGFLITVLKQAALAGPSISPSQVILDPQMTEQLRALGYIQN